MAGAGNVISGNMARGLNVGAFGTGTVFTVQGNLIGTDPTGTLPVPNGYYGVRATANGAAIGGTGAGEGNVIAYNLGGGAVDDAGETGISIRGNSIHDNGFGQLGHGVGIDFSTLIGGDGVTPNDAGDGDTGPNNYQNFPIVSSAAALATSSGTHVQGVLHSTPSTTFDLDFYANDACIPHPHDFQQGRTYLGSGQVTTDGSGKGSFFVYFPTLCLDPWFEAIRSTPRFAKILTRAESRRRKMAIAFENAGGEELLGIAQRRAIQP